MDYILSVDQIITAYLRHGIKDAAQVLEEQVKFNQPEAAKDVLELAKNLLGHISISMQIGNEDANLWPVEPASGTEGMFAAEIERIFQARIAAAREPQLTREQGTAALYLDTEVTRLKQELANAESEAKALREAIDKSAALLSDGSCWVGAQKANKQPGADRCLKLLRESWDVLRLAALATPTEGTPHRCDSCLYFDGEHCNSKCENWEEWEPIAEVTTREGEREIGDGKPWPCLRASICEDYLVPGAMKGKE